MRWSGKKTKRLYTAGWQSLLLIASHLVGNLGCSDRFRHRFAIKRVLARRKSMLVCSVAFSFCAFLSLYIYIFFFSSSSSLFFFSLRFYLLFISFFFFFGFFIECCWVPFYLFHHVETLMMDIELVSVVNSQQNLI